MREAVRRLTREGLSYVDYKTGHRNRLDVAVDRAIRTGVNQMVSQSTLAMMDELGAEYVETTAHAGARDTHVPWQGKVFKKSAGTSNALDIYKSVSAMKASPDVLLPDGTFGTIEAGSHVSKIVTFAGKGTRTPLRVAKFLEEEYNIPASEWKKVRGEAKINNEDYSEMHVSEIHWYEAEQSGMVKAKVKIYFT